MKTQLPKCFLGILLFILISLLQGCGSKDKASSETQDPLTTFQEQTFSDQSEISEESWNAISENVAPEMGVQIGMNFFALSRNIDINEISQLAPRKKSSISNVSRPDNTDITNRTTIRGDVRYLRENYLDKWTWELLHNKQQCKEFSIIVLGPKDEGYSDLESVTFDIKNDLKIIKMRVESYLELRSEIEYAYSNSGRFLDSISTEEIDYYQTYARSLDIRGLYFLQKTGMSKSELFEHWQAQTESQSSSELNLNSAFNLLCLEYLAVKGEKFDCVQKLSQHTLTHEEFEYLMKYSENKKQELFSIYSEDHLPQSEYKIENVVGKKIITIYAQRPSDPIFADFFKSSVEKYWQTTAYQLKLAWADEYARSALIHIEFSDEGTNRAYKKNRLILMNSFRFRYDEVSEATIAHEFGHLLGFSDCYVEFYETESSSMVEYKIDPSNLMCSTAGWIQPQHFEEFLKSF